jgi:Subtilase family
MCRHFCVSLYATLFGFIIIFTCMAHQTFIDGVSPGRSITSAWYTSSTASRTLSGTSMATPLVTGVAALYLQRDPTMTPQQVKDAMVADGATGLVPNSQGSPNVIVSTAALTGSSPTAPVRAPTAPVRTPTAPVRTPTAPVRTPTAPVRTPTAPVRTPTAPVRTPTAPVRRPAIPISTPVRGSPTSQGCRIFLGSCSTNSDCCSNRCRSNVCFPF